MLWLGILGTACGSWSASTPDQQPPPGSPTRAAKLSEALRVSLDACLTQRTVVDCEPAIAAFDGATAEHAGRGRTVDMVLGALARLADDEEQALLARDADATRVAVTEKHLSGAVDAMLEALRAASVERADPYVGVVPSADTEREAVAHLHDQFERYAFVQGVAPQAVRWRQLHSRLGRMEAESAAMAESPRVLGYRALLSTYRDTLEAYRAGAVVDEATRTRWIESVSTARAAWEKGLED